jgi:hypothetical protein
MSTRSDQDGPQRARVQLELDGQAVRPVGLWLLDSPAVQRDSLAGPYIARIDVAGTLAMLQSLGDPFSTRAIQRPDQVGHSYSPLTRTTVQVDIPITSPSDLAHVSIRIADLSEVSERPAEWPSVAALLERETPGVQWLHAIDTAELRKLPDWREVVD